MRFMDRHSILRNNDHSDNVIRTTMSIILHSTLMLCSMLGCTQESRKTCGTAYNMPKGGDDFVEHLYTNIQDVRRKSTILRQNLYQ